MLLLGVYRTLWRRQQSPALLAQAAGALGWYAATVLWLAGMPIPEIVPWLAVFVIATIAGERLELAHVALRGPAAARWFLAALAALFAGATAATLWRGAGTRLFGAGLLAVTAWLAVFDVARHTGERVRVWVLNAGPNRGTAFHVVDGQFDTVYREGRWLLRPGDPGAAQVLDLTPAGGGFVETVLPAAGHYPFVIHVMVDAGRGARGAIEVR